MNDKIYSQLLFYIVCPISQIQAFLLHPDTSADAPVDTSLSDDLLRLINSINQRGISSIFQSMQ